VHIVKLTSSVLGVLHWKKNNTDIKHTYPRDQRTDYIDVLPNVLGFAVRTNRGSDTQVFT